jgi:hypothetical protein
MVRNNSLLVIAALCAIFAGVAFGIGSGNQSFGLTVMIILLVFILMVWKIVGRRSLNY